MHILWQVDSRGEMLERWVWFVYLPVTVLAGDRWHTPAEGTKGYLIKGSLAVAGRDSGTRQGWCPPPRGVGGGWLPWGTFLRLRFRGEGGEKVAEVVGPQ